MKRGWTSDVPPSVEHIKACIERRLFLGRLPAGCTEDEVREVYSAFGPLTECRVLTQKGVAFVAYDSWATTHRAQMSTDGQLVLPSAQAQDGMPVVALFAEKSGSPRGTGGSLSRGLSFRRVLVSGLSEACQEAELRQICGQRGQVLHSLTVLESEAGSWSASLEMGTWGEAMDVIEALDQLPGSPSGEPLVAMLAGQYEDAAAVKRRRANGGGMAQAPGGGVAGLADTDFEQLLTAYVTAAAGDASVEACDELHRKIMQRRPASRRFQPALAGAGAAPPAAVWLSHSPAAAAQAAPPDERGTARVLVGGLPGECGDEELRALVEQVPFASAARLLECRVLPGRGCGHVRFDTGEAARQAIDSLNGRRVSGWQLPLRVSWATQGAADGGALPPTAAGGDAQEQLVQVLSGNPGLMNAVQSLLTGGGSPQAPGVGCGLSAEEREVVARGEDPRRLFVGQLLRELGDQGQAILTRLFEQFGQVESVRWIAEKGVAYIAFLEFDAANTAKKHLHGQHLPGVSLDRGANVSFSKSRTRGM